jgi:hypothetical protein
VATHSVNNAAATADRASKAVTERVGVSADRVAPEVPDAAPCQPKGNGISVLTP